MLLGKFGCEQEVYPFTFEEDEDYEYSMHGNTTWLTTISICTRQMARNPDKAL